MIVCNLCGDRQVSLGARCRSCGGTGTDRKARFNTPLVDTKDRWASRYILLTDPRATPHIRRKPLPASSLIRLPSVSPPLQPRIKLTGRPLPPLPAGHHLGLNTSGAYSSARRVFSSSRNATEPANPTGEVTPTYSRPAVLPSILRSRETDIVRRHSLARRASRTRSAAKSKTADAERSINGTKDHVRAGVSAPHLEKADREPVTYRDGQPCHACATAPPPKEKKEVVHGKAKKRLLGDLKHIHSLPPQPPVPVLMAQVPRGTLPVRPRSLENDSTPSLNRHADGSRPSRAISAKHVLDRHVHGDDDELCLFPTPDVYSDKGTADSARQVATATGLPPAPRLIPRQTSSRLTIRSPTVLAEDVATTFPSMHRRGALRAINFTRPTGPRRHTDTPHVPNSDHPIRTSDALDPAHPDYLPLVDVPIRPSSAGAKPAKQSRNRKPVPSIDETVALAVSGAVPPVRPIPVPMPPSDRSLGQQIQEVEHSQPQSFHGRVMPDPPKLNIEKPIDAQSALVEEPTLIRTAPERRRSPDTPILSASMKQYHRMRLPGSWPTPPSQSPSRLDTRIQISARNATDLDRIPPAARETPAPARLVIPPPKPILQLSAVPPPPKGTVAQLKVHFEKVMAIHQAASMPVSPISAVDRAASAARFATVNIPMVNTHGEVNNTRPPLIISTEQGQSGLSSHPTNALRRLGGGTTACPTCRQLVARLDKDRVVGPYDVAWHAGCLKCGADTDAEEGKQRRKRGCGKRLDSRAGIDVHGTVWCTRCSLEGRVQTMRQPSITPSSALPHSLKIVRNGRIVSLKHPRPVPATRSGALYSPLLGDDGNESHQLPQVADRIGSGALAQRVGDEGSATEASTRVTWVRTRNGMGQTDGRELRLLRRGALVVRVPRRSSGKWVRRLEMRL